MDFGGFFSWIYWLPGNGYFVITYTGVVSLYICVSYTTGNCFGISSFDSPKFCRKSISIPLAIVEMGTSFAEPSNGFSPVLPILSMV